MATMPINHLALMAQRLLWQFRDSANFQSLAQSLGAEVNEIEAALSALEGLTVDGEAGVQLDGDGDLLGVNRDGRTDVDYRAAIHAQTRVNRGQGRIEDILFALDLMIPGGDFELTEAPATVYVDVLSGLGAGDPTATEVAAILDRLLGGGIAHALIYSSVAEDETFTLAAGDTVQTSTTQGLADDGQTTGGRLADAIA